MKKKTKEGDSPLVRQFRKWAAGLVRVNPRYVTDPEAIVWYIKGPNWSDPDPEYAHYRFGVSLYGDELLEEFERIRSLPDEEARSEYRRLKDMAGVGDGDGRRKGL